MLFVSLFSLMVRTIHPCSSDLIFRKKFRHSHTQSSHVISMLCSIASLGAVKFINQQSSSIKQCIFKRKTLFRQIMIRWDENDVTLNKTIYWNILKMELPAGNLFCFKISFKIAFCLCDGRMKEGCIQNQEYMQINICTCTYTSTHIPMHAYICA